MIDLSAPRFEVRVGGVALPPTHARLIDAVVVEASQDGADELRIEATAWDSVARAFRFLGDPVIGVGAVAEVWGGYGDRLEPIQRFRMLREEAEYPDGGVPRVVLRGYSAEHRLAEEVRAAVWAGPVADSEIAAQIARSAGLAADADGIAPTPPRQAGRVKAQGTSDLDFLRQLATANGFAPPSVVWDAARGVDRLLFRPLDYRRQGERVRFVYSPPLAGSSEPAGTLLSFSPSLSLAGVPTTVEAIAWDPAAQEAIIVRASIDAVDQEPTVQRRPENYLKKAGISGYKSGSQVYARVLLDSEVPDAEPPPTSRRARGKVESRAVYTVQNATDAVAWAKRWITTRNQAFLIARAATVGWPRVWVGQIHEFVGLAPVHDGLWFVEAVRHRWDGQGYRLDLDLSRVLDEAAPPRES